MLRAKRIPAIAVLGLIGSSATLATLVLVGPARTVFFLSQSRLFVLLPVAGLVFGALSMGAVILGLNALLGARARSTQSGHDRHARYGLLLGALGTLPVCLSVWVVAGAGDPLLESLAAHDDDLIVALREIADDMEVDSEGEVVSLTLWNSGTTDDALSHLKRLEKLEVLALNSSGITDQGVKHLLSNVRLRHLTFGDTRINDQSLVYIGQLSSLESLSLRAVSARYGEAAITDAGVRHLTGLSNLRQLDLRGTRVSEQGMRRLSRALPHCEILRSRSADADSTRD